MSKSAPLINFKIRSLVSGLYLSLEDSVTDLGTTHYL